MNKYPKRQSAERLASKYSLPLIGSLALLSTIYFVNDRSSDEDSPKTNLFLETDSFPLTEGAMVPIEAIEASNRYIDTYGCKDPEDFTFSVVEDLDGMPLAEPLGSADNNDIAFSTAIDSLETLKSVAIHETGHACSAGIILFEQPITGTEYTDGVAIIGARGFQFYFEDKTFVNEMEEGIVEWLSMGVDGYIPTSDSGYLAVSGVMETIADIRGLSRQQLADLHQNSDLLTFISLAKARPVEQLSSYDVLEMVFLFQDAYYSGMNPPKESVAMILNYPTNYVGAP